MDSHSRISDVVPEILDPIFKDVCNNDLSSFPTNLSNKDLPASTPDANFHPGTNEDSLKPLWQLSKYPSAVDIAETQVHTVRVQNGGLDEFLKLQWERHLKEYCRKCPMPKCVTMDDVHKAVGVKNWRSCRTCAEISPREQFNRFTRFVKANIDTSGTAEAVLVLAFD